MSLYLESKKVTFYLLTLDCLSVHSCTLIFQLTHIKLVPLILDWVLLCHVLFLGFPSIPSPSFYSCFLFKPWSTSLCIGHVQSTSSLLWPQLKPALSIISVFMLIYKVFVPKLLLWCLFTVQRHPNFLNLVIIPFPRFLTTGDLIFLNQYSISCSRNHDSTIF